MGDANERDPGLPIKLQPCSNTEFDPFPANAVVREAARRARAMAEERARKLGMPRRRFLLSSMGAATTLAALSACSRESSEANGGGSEPDGGHVVSDEATVDPDAALEELGDAQPVIDVQTHFLEYPESGATTIADAVAGGVSGFSAIGYNSDCDLEANPMECLSNERWIEEVFGRSDTTMAVISALPFGSGTEADPLNPDIMAEGRRQLMELCEDEGDRVLIQGHGQPNQGDPQQFFDDMEREAENYDIVAWKSYTHVGGGWMLDDSLSGGDRVEEFEGREEAIGSRYLEKVQDLHDRGIGPNIVCVHKGLTVITQNLIGSPYGSPSDIGPAATNFPDLRFCVYHSGYELGTPEGPYDPEGGGVDRLIKSLEDSGIQPQDPDDPEDPNANVYAELGGTWRNLMAMADDETKMHVIGKLLKYVGPDRVLWGTDSIWFGSPQDQIQALRTFQISKKFQDEYGYPELTDEIKHKIFWRNAARLHGIDAYRLQCQVAVDRADPKATEEARQNTRLGNWTYGPNTPAMSRRMFLASHPWATSQA